MVLRGHARDILRIFSRQCCVSTLKKRMIALKLIIEKDCKSAHHLCMNIRNMHLQFSCSKIAKMVDGTHVIVYNVGNRNVTPVCSISGEEVSHV